MTTKASATAISSTAQEFVWSERTVRLGELFDKRREPVVVRTTNRFVGGNGIDDILAGQVCSTIQYFMQLIDLSTLDLHKHGLRIC